MTTESRANKLAHRYLIIALAILALSVMALAVFAAAQDAHVNLTVAQRLTMTLCSAPLMLGGIFGARAALDRYDRALKQV